jgi:hypothetical protein
MRPHAMLRVTSLYVGGGARAPQRARAPTPGPMPQMQPAMVVNFTTPLSRPAHLAGRLQRGRAHCGGPVARKLLHHHCVQLLDRCLRLIVWVHSAVEWL